MFMFSVVYRTCRTLHC